VVLAITVVLPSRDLETDTILGSKIILYGGPVKDGESSCAKLFILDTETNHWESMDTITSLGPNGEGLKRQFTSIAAIENKLYLIPVICIVHIEDIYLEAAETTHIEMTCGVWT
jgi:hypothetical protein